MQLEYQLAEMARMKRLIQIQHQRYHNRFSIDAYIKQKNTLHIQPIASYIN